MGERFKAVIWADNGVVGESGGWKLTFTKAGERKNVKVNNYSLTLDMAKELLG